MIILITQGIGAFVLGILGFLFINWIGSPETYNLFVFLICQAISFYIVFKKDPL